MFCIKKMSIKMNPEFLTALKAQKQCLQPLESHLHLTIPNLLCKIKVR